METDDQLRIRIRYVAGDSREFGAAGAKLDEVADRYGLKRRRIDSEETAPIKQVSMFQNPPNGEPW